MLPIFDRTATVIVLPCSGSKADGGSAIRDPGIVDQLPAPLAAELAAARRRVARLAKLDESRLLPAWRRYTGSLYQVAQPAFSREVGTGAHVLIISGGYGLVLASEPIGCYNRRFRLSDWPPRLLEGCLESYARRHRLQVAIAFLAMSGDYARLVRSWAGAGVTKAYLVLPDMAGKGGAQVLVPRACGEALTAFLGGAFTAGWSTVNGICVEIEPLK